MLLLWDKLTALARSADADDVGLWSLTNASRIDRRSAFGAKRLRPLRPPFAGLDVDFQLASEELESAFAGECDRAKGRTG